MTLKSVIKCFLWRDTSAKSQLSISQLKRTVLFPPYVVCHAENGTPAVTKWLSGMNITFTFAVDFLKNGQIAGWFEIKSTMSDFLHLKSTSEQFLAQVTREIDLCLPVFCPLIKTPQRCLASEIFDSPFRMLHKTVSHSRGGKAAEHPAPHPFEWWK